MHLFTLNKTHTRHIFKWVMPRPQTILERFYKMLMWLTFYWFWSRPTINITFLFTNNYLSHQQFVQIFVKLFVSQVLFYSKITSQTQKEIDLKFKLGITTVNPPEERPVFALPTRGLKLITLPTWTSIRYPSVTHLTPSR